MASKKTKNIKQAKLTEQFVAFVDLLGFTDEMVRASKDSVQAEALLTSFQSTVAQTVREVLVPSKDLPLWNYRGFTDNFVVAAPVRRHDGDDGEGRFGMLSTRVAEFQLQLALQGWFVRGGLTMGDFFMDDLSVFGPALVDAYFLESKFARDPRIILSESVRELVKSHLRYYGSGYDSPQNMFVLVDVDGYPFINYLFAAIDGGGGEDGVDLVRQHKTCVEEKLNQYQSNPPIWAKYRWVASYHDFFCKHWLSKYKDELRISSKALAASPRLLVDKP